MFPPYRFAQLLALLLMVMLLLSACGGGGGSSEQSTTLEIKGRVLNGPLDGSTVQVFGANGGSVLGTATTDSEGRYAAQVSGEGPYRLRVSGGELNGVDYAGVLEAACAGGSNCFVTPYTTVILRLVDDHGFNTGDAASHLATSLDFDGDPFVGGVPAEAFDLNAARQAIAGGDGLATWVASVVVWATGDASDPPPGISEPDSTDTLPPSEPELISDRYLPLGDSEGVIRDIETGFEWKRCSVGQDWNSSSGSCEGEPATFFWDDAVEAYGTWDDVTTWPDAILNEMKQPFPSGEWRLPTIEQLGSLLYCSTGNPTEFDPAQPCEGFDFTRPTIDLEAFPDSPASDVWSGSSDWESGDFIAWRAHFWSGYTTSNFARGSLNPIRLVRDPAQ